MAFSVLGWSAAGAASRVRGYYAVHVQTNRCHVLYPTGGVDCVAMRSTVLTLWSLSEKVLFAGYVAGWCGNLPRGGTPPTLL